jgi:D-cysteine desulfhydrase
MMLDPTLLSRPAGPEPAVQGAPLPLVQRFPALASVRRLALGTFPSPVMRLHGLDTRGAMWVKRDDLNAPSFGGNKVRALEFLLAGVPAGGAVLTAGGEGSTHVLSTAGVGRALGLRVTAIRWRHDMNPAAQAVAARAAALCTEVRTTATPVGAFLAALAARARGGYWWVPPGGTSPLGMLGQVNAALELAAQISRGELPAPRYVVVPLGSGGTAAGLALGFASAGLDTTVVAARVAPRLAANHLRLLALARSCATLIRRLGGQAVPRVSAMRIRVAHDVYGGGYGRALPAARGIADELHRRTGIALDDTYSAKAFAAAIGLAHRSDEPILFWLTFDARAIQA